MKCACPNPLPPTEIGLCAGCGLERELYVLINARLFDEDRFAAEDGLIAWLEKLVELNESYLDAYPNTPLLYESKIRYAANNILDGFLDISNALRRGRADADTLVCWRVTELRRQGIDAHPEIVKIPRQDGGITYTCRVRLPDGSVEDVVEIVRGRKSS